MKQLINIFAGLIVIAPVWGCNQKQEDVAHKYSIAIPVVENGLATAALDGRTVTEARAGAVVTLTATPGEDWKFHSWGAVPEDMEFDDRQSPLTTFVMPARDVTVTPLFVVPEFISDGEWLGTVTFRSTDQWTVGEQVWSDAVMAARCRKDEFDGGPEGPYKADCRQSEGFGDLFSWEVIGLYSSDLCPEGWRIPTKRDFFDLDVALGGSGSGGTGSESALYNVWQKYLADWGAQPGGFARTANPEVVFPGAVACYWSQTELDDDRAYYLYVYSGRVYPQYNETKDLGMSVRCVTDRLQR